MRWTPLSRPRTERNKREQAARETLPRSRAAAGGSERLEVDWMLPLESRDFAHLSDAASLVFPFLAHQVQLRGRTVA